MQRAVAVRLGHSLVVSGRLAFPGSRTARLRETFVDCSVFDDWPAEGLFDAGPGVAATFDVILAAFAAQPRTQVEWSRDNVRVVGLVPVDAPHWRAGGLTLVAAFRAAGAIGASGGMALTGWTDGGPADVISIQTKGDGTSSVSIMRGAHAENAALALHQHVLHLAG